ncbi:MAG: DUF87 domain-containing protein [Candidatus Zixiibacteriota bacterium]
MNEKRQKQQLVQGLLDYVYTFPVWVRNALHSLTISWNEALYSRVLDFILNNQEVLTTLSSPFELPRSQAYISGDLNLGSIIHTNGLRLKVRTSDLNRHTLVAGTSGSGKTQLALLMAQQILQYTDITLRIIDPKADEYRILAQIYNILDLDSSELRFNPFTAGANTPKRKWYPSVVGHLAERFNFWQGAEGFLIELIYSLEEKQIPVNIDSLLTLAKKTHTFSYKDKAVLSTVKSRLTMLSHLFEDSIKTESTMLEALHSRHAIISTTGLMAEAESWITEFLFLWEYTYRVNNPEKRNPMIFIFDEVQHRLFSSSKERSINAQSSPLISKLVDEARSMNLGIIALSQEPSCLISAILNSSWLKVAMRLGSGIEIKIMKEAMGLTDEQAQEMFYFEPGEAIVRMAGGYMDALPVKFDQFREIDTSFNKDFPEYQEVRRLEFLNASSVRNNQVVVNQIKKPDLSISISSNQLLLPTANRRTIQSPNTESSTSQEKAITELEPLEFATSRPDQLMDVKSILSIWLNLPTPFLTQGEIFKKAGIVSGSKQATTKRKAIREKLIIEHRLQVKKTYSIIWEPTEKAYHTIGKQKPTLKSKGGYLHKFIAYRVLQWAKNNYYIAKTEFMLSNGKSVDLVLTKGSEVIFVEIAVSSPLEKEMINIEKDFSTEYLPTTFTLLAVNGKAKRRLEELIAKHKLNDEITKGLKVRLAGEYLK